MHSSPSPTLPVKILCHCCETPVMQSFEPENLPTSLILYCSPCASAICTLKNILTSKNIYRTGVFVDSQLWLGSYGQHGAHMATRLKNIGINKFISDYTILYTKK